MPKRTNDFQGLITLLNQQLVPAGAKVTESNLLEDPVTHRPREGDVTIEYEFAGYRIRLVIECRAHKEPQDVSWIDELIGKYLHQTSQVIAVSSSGFTPQAEEKAKQVGILTMTIEEATDQNWAKWVKEVDSIWVTFVGNFMVDIFNINLVDKSIPSFKAQPLVAGKRAGDIVFEDPSGVRRTAWEIFQEASNSPQFGAELSGSERQPDGLNRFRLGLPPGTKILMADGSTHAAEGIGYLVRQDVETVQVPLKPGTYGVHSIATGAATGHHWKVQIVFTRDTDGKPKMGVRATKTSGKLEPGTRVSLYGIGEPIAPPSS